MKPPPPLKKTQQPLTENCLSETFSFNKAISKHHAAITASKSPVLILTCLFQTLRVHFLLCNLKWCMEEASKHITPLKLLEVVGLSAGIQMNPPLCPLTYMHNKNRLINTHLLFLQHDCV